LPSCNMIDPLTTSSFKSIPKLPFTPPIDSRYLVRLLA
jgi:hypothetical protein